MKSSLRLSVPAMLAVLMGSSGVSANEWIGTWASPRCGADSIQIELSRSELDLSTFETNCRVRSVTRRGRDYQIDATCSSDGRRISASFLVRVEGGSLTFVRQNRFEFDPKRFVRCR